MSDRIKCKTCERMILHVTAEHNEGLCGPCWNTKKKEAKPVVVRQFNGKYDDASWHYGGDFPSSLPNSAGATHIGMFVVSCIFNGMVGELHEEDFPEILQDLMNRRITPGAWVMEFCDEKFTDEELTEEGNEFALEYYYSDEGLYGYDYDSLVCRSYESAYEVPDSWETFEIVNKFVTQRLAEWREQKQFG